MCSYLHEDVTKGEGSGSGIQKEKSEQTKIKQITKREDII